MSALAAHHALRSGALHLLLCAPAARALRAWLLLLWLAVAGLSALASEAALHLQAGDSALNLWRGARLLHDPTGQLGLAEVLQRSTEFTTPQQPLGNLGRRQGAVWLQVPLTLHAGAARQWMLQFDYPPLDRIDVYLLDGSHVEQHALLGDHVPRSQRPLLTRSPVVPVVLPAEGQRLLMVRVASEGSLLVPAWLLSPAVYQQRETAEQALQGLLAGMGLCLLVYTLAQWLVLREAVFGLYALVLVGNVGFFAALSGMGPLYLWSESAWLTRNGPPFTILLGVAGATLFVHSVLRVRERAPRMSVLILACAALSGGTAVLFLLGLVSYATAQSVGMALGFTPLALVLPLAWRCMREGDRGATYLLLGWTAYAVGVLAIVALLAGWLELGFWSMHGFQFASLLEMSMWMLVLGERVQALRRSAVRAQSERDVMRSLAYTDVLTGLLNRRGLEDGLARLLAERPVNTRVALYLLDLDAFKEVNDTHGHDVGDALLRGVARRLRETVREPHLVCRLGGDEFVVVAAQLATATDATAVGLKLLRAFDEPVDMISQDPAHAGAIRRHLQRVTIGFALAPQDADSLGPLLKCADAGLYAGKQAGKQCLRRGRLPWQASEPLA